MNKDDLEKATRSGRGAWRQNWRPEGAIVPGPGDESVWDYPRPPIIDDAPGPVRILHSQQVIAETHNARQIKETASPPTVYVPPQDCDFSFIKEGKGLSVCEWKGQATYYDVIVPDSPAIRQAAWSYEDPFESIIKGMGALKGWLCFYPAKVECYLADERVRPQPGQFYGGWVTDRVKGPFKGEPGTGGW